MAKVSEDSLEVDLVVGVALALKRIEGEDADLPGFGTLYAIQYRQRQIMTAAADALVGHRFHVSNGGPVGEDGRQTTQHATYEVLGWRDT